MYRGKVQPFLEECKGKNTTDMADLLNVKESNR
jgi:hypothetical protein